MPLWEHCKLVRRTLSKRFYPNVIRNLECLSKTDFVVLPTLSLFVVRFFFSRILFLRTHTTALTYSINLEMGKRGIEPPLFTAWERIYSPPQHRQSLPLPRNWNTRNRTRDSPDISRKLYHWAMFQDCICLRNWHMHFYSFIRSCQLRQSFNAPRIYSIACCDSFWWTP